MLPRLLLFAAALAVSRPAGAASDLVLICYLYQSGGGGTPVKFIRRLDVDTKANTVAIADDLGGAGFRPLGAYGKLVSLDDAALVFDFAAAQTAGRATVDRHDGTYSYTDGRIAITGNCAPSRL